MTAYYNEHDKYAAAWLRNLIAAGLIAPGDVDERSIEDVKPSELAGYTQCHFFAGVGVWSHALRNAGWSDDRPVWTGSCPCQPFSAAGKGGGEADERHLWPAFFHLIQHAKPRDVVVFGEQVASKPGLAWLDLVHADLEGQGYAVGAIDLCAAGVGAPHIRQRSFFCAVDDAQSARRSVLDTENQRAANAPVDPSADSSGGAVGSGSRSSARRAEHPTSDGRIERGSESGRGRAELRRGSGVALGDTSGEGLAKQRGKRGASSEASSRASRKAVERTGTPTARLLEDTERAEGERFGQHGGQRIRFEETAGLAGSGGCRGWWRESDWLRCADQKYRPVEPGTFPLAHGATARVGRLRAYGNAIVAPAAEAFIRAYLERSALDELL